ncbi:DUF6850 family outer membrane beta-barrel protein [Chitinophaga sp. XS-30]|uniref:DUF6850 family outer membrane beta-barrel protein n=1 Tax=Chitinophaga sp. XS-30 TaxID=2604421 RepID=UPI0011DCDE02|nr:DUF6850 family outer membrane beta-barrel protein [Chitinophaga sp. XS-30]QEH40851.1 hypothetical protein FW415_08180 [Chitinophaga sp. XS-30]
MTETHFTRVIFSGLLLILSATATAQTVSDSIWLYRPAQAAYRQAVSSVAGLASYPVANTGMLSLTGRIEDGGLRQAQVPQQHKDITFSTTGLRTIQRFRVYGKFTYQRSSQDSLSWSLMGIPDHMRPFYYASRKAGSFDRQLYDISGRIAYTLKEDRLYIGSGVTYLYHTAHRQEDPRPSVKNFSLVLKPELAWQQGRHVTGIMAMWGYGYESNSIKYMNPRYQFNYDSYPERRTWLMMGMGYMQPRASNSQQLDVRVRTWGSAVHHAYNGTDWQWKNSLSWERRLDKYGSPQSTTVKDLEWGTYTLDNYRLNLSAASGLQHTFNLEASYIRGDDKNTYSGSPLLPALNAQNYRNRFSSIVLDYGKTGVKNTGWGASIQWQQSEREDFVTAHSLQYSHLTPMVHGELYAGKQFYLQLKAGVRCPLTQMINVLPTQRTAFSMDVLFRDYYYWSSTAGTLQLHANYISRKIIDKMPAGVRLKIVYDRLLRETERTVADVPEIGAYRLQGALSFSLYL